MKKPKTKPKSEPKSPVGYRFIKRGKRYDVKANSLTEASRLVKEIISLKNKNERN